MSESPVPIVDEEWVHKASMVLAQFVSLGADPGWDAWGRVAMQATELLCYDPPHAKRPVTQAIESIHGE